MNVTIQIDRLILEGINLTPAQTPLLQAAVESELARLVAAGGLASSLRTGGAMAYVPAALLQLAGDNQHDPTALGQQIAQSVYGGLGR